MPVGAISEAPKNDVPRFLVLYRLPYPDFMRAKFREVEYEFNGKNFLAQIGQRFLQQPSERVPVGQPFGADAPLVSRRPERRHSRLRLPLVTDAEHGDRRYQGD
jgi:hypothetical protein